MRVQTAGASLELRQLVDISRESGHLRAEERETPVQPVAKTNRHPVASTDSQRLQTAGHTRRPIPKLAVVDSLAAKLDDRLVLGPGINGGSQHGNKRIRAAGILSYATRVAHDSGVVKGSDHQ